MAATPYFTSDGIIEAVKRKIAAPTYQSTLTDEGILKFANEEMQIALIPKIMSYHEEYFSTIQVVDLVANKSSYAIPDRAIGGKLRDVFLRDINGNLTELTRIDSDERAYYQGRSLGQDNYRFYLQGGDVVLVPEVGIPPTDQQLYFVYHLRPNQLVTEEKANVLTSFQKNITVDNAFLSAGDTFTLGGTVFEAVAGGPTGNQWLIGGSSISSASNLAAAISASGLATATTSSAVVMVQYTSSTLSFASSDASALAIQATRTLLFQEPVDSQFVAGQQVDFLQTRGGHKTLAMDVTIPSGGVGGSSMTFLDASVPEDMVVGDYVALAGEAIIPQIPSELHIALIERVCARFLSSIGDLEGVASINQKLQEIETTTTNLINNRVDGAPKKISHRNGLLARNKRRYPGGIF